MRIGIAGYGVVGAALARLFSRGGSHHVEIYDKYIEHLSSANHLEALNSCEIVFVAVPTPYDPLTSACDLSQINDIVDRITTVICIVSTVPPGTTDGLIARTGKRIVFSPEYLGESPDHPWQEADDCGFVVAGGEPELCALVRAAYEQVHAHVEFVATPQAAAAELVKYMDTCFLATKVSFANQFSDLARQANVDFTELRRLFVLDPRVGSSHTMISPERGFGGKCLPKDMRSIIAWAAQGDGAPLLQGVLSYNEQICKAQK